MRHIRSIAVLLCAAALWGCATTQSTTTTSGGSIETSAASAPAAPAPPSGMTVTPSGLQYEDLRVGDGTLAEPGMEVLINYLGTFPDGRKFDSSYDRQKPLRFRIGAGTVVQGMEEGVTGMRVGGKRRAIVPPSLAYGATGFGNGHIPPHATLVFEIELLDTR